jgi:hypothetical protein
LEGNQIINPIEVESFGDVNAHVTGRFAGPVV